jgi:hypothetical protein
MTHADYDHDAFTAGIREHLREIDAFQNQFENPYVGVIALTGGYSIQAAIKAGLPIKPEYRQNPIENPNLGHPTTLNFELITHEEEAS